jgi:thiol-disulfide isomerase/thioredoxin
MSRWYNRKILGFLNLERLLWITLIIVGIFYYFRYQTVTKIETADIQMQDTNGSTVSLNQYIGDKPTVVHFYASWCGPCLKELPMLAEHAHSLLPEQVQWVLITEDNEEKVEIFRNRYKLNIFRANRLKDIGIHSIPVSYIYRQGELVYSHLGPIDWNDPEWHKEFFNYIK